MAKTTSKGAKIASKANELAYKINTKEARYPSGHPTQNFKTAFNKVFKGFHFWSKASRLGASCDVFVGTVVRASGVDPNFPAGLWKQLNYMEKNMIKINAANIDPSKLRDGDIGFYRKDKLGRHGHIFIYAYGKIKEASAGTYYGKTTESVKGHFSSKNRKYVYIFRFKDSTLVDSEEETDINIDNGAGIDLTQTISNLYSSDNYQYINLAEEDTFSTYTAEYNSRLKNSLSQVNFYDEPRQSGALPENIVNQNFSEIVFEKNKPDKVLTGKSTQLLSYPTLVEAPTIVLDFNGIKIGGYGNTGDLYPNYINSMSVKKTNGRINQYTFNLTYQVRFGEDPNFIDKLIARTGYTNPLKILYGDSNLPNSYYREEAAVITNVTHSEDISAYRINYTISAISSIAAAQTSLMTYKEKTAKPSSMIYDLLYNSGDISRNLIELFPGMRNRSMVASLNLIPTTDAVIKVGGMKNTSPLNYLSYLVANMKNDNHSYYLTIVDESANQLGGAYFKINEIIGYNNQTNSDVQINANYFELDIGYPSNNFITNFQICNNDYWSLVYDYSGNIPKFEYGIDDNGDLIKNKTNILYRTNKYNESSLLSSNWWNQVTEFPITAKVTVKGLLSPVMLMSYIKVNAIFYGERDMASGLYVVTSQDDYISGSGYTTVLTLLRVAGDK